MAIAFNSASSAQGQNVSSLTFAHTCAGSDRFLFVGVGTSAAFPPWWVSSVTYNGVALTRQWELVAQTSFNNSGYYLINPPSGTFNVVMTLAGVNSETCAGAMSFTGCDQTAPVVSSATASGFTTSAAVLLTAIADQVAIDNVYVHQASLTPEAQQTTRWTQTNIPPGPTAGAGSTEFNGSTVSSWTLNMTKSWLIGALVVKPPSMSVTGTMATTLDSAVLSAVGAPTETPASGPAVIRIPPHIALINF